MSDFHIVHENHAVYLEKAKVTDGVNKLKEEVCSEQEPATVL